MARTKLTIFIIGVLFIHSLINTTECKRQKTKQSDLHIKETNIPNFVRLVIMRLIFGIAASMGLEDRISGFLGGIFVPPGVEDYSDYGDDYDYGTPNIFQAGF